MATAATFRMAFGLDFAKFNLGFIIPKINANGNTVIVNANNPKSIQADLNDFQIIE